MERNAIHDQSYVSVYPLERTFPLHALPISCGRGHETDSGYRWDGTKRGTGEFAVFQYTLRGEGRLVMSGITYPALPGTLMIAPVPSNHIYDLPEKSCSWDFLYIVATGSEVMRIARGIVRRSGPMNAISRATADRMSQFIDRCSTGADLSPFQLSASMYQLLMLLLDEILMSGSSVEPSWLRAVKQYCRDHADIDLSIDQLSEVAALSKYHFIREFSRLEGITPAKYAEHQRIKRAISLLNTTNNPVHAVGEMCGYTDTNYFCRAFKRVTGLSPGSYRKTGG